MAQMNTKPATLLWELIGRLADSCLTFRISGEPGVGKEAIAHLIHRHYPHNQSDFIKFNCQELQNATHADEFSAPLNPSTASLLSALDSPENKLFYFENIQFLPEKLQLLLQNMLNNNYPTAPPWVFAASITPLEHDQTHALDPALFKVLDTVHIAVPPLRRHPDKIAQILSWFLHVYSQKAPEDLVAMPAPRIMDILTSYPWPGNLGQLQHLACKAFATSDWNSALKELDSHTIEVYTQGVDEIAAIYMMSLAKLSIHKEKIIEAFIAASKTDEVGLLDLAIYHEAVSQMADHIAANKNETVQNE